MTVNFYSFYNVLIARLSVVCYQLIALQQRCDMDFTVVTNRNNIENGLNAAFIKVLKTIESHLIDEAEQGFFS